MNVLSISTFKPQSNKNVAFRNSTQNFLPKYNQSCDSVSFRGGIEALDGTVKSIAQSLKDQAIKFVQEVRGNKNISDWLKKAANTNDGTGNSVLDLSTGKALSAIRSKSGDVCDCFLHKSFDKASEIIGSGKFALSQCEIGETKSVSVVDAVHNSAIFENGFGFVINSAGDSIGIFKDYQNALTQETRIRL